FTGEWRPLAAIPWELVLASMESPAFTGEWLRAPMPPRTRDRQLQWSHQLSLVNGDLIAAFEVAQLKLQWSHQLSLVNGVDFMASLVCPVLLQWIHQLSLVNGARFPRWVSGIIRLQWSPQLSPVNGKKHKVVPFETRAASMESPAFTGEWRARGRGSK